MSLHVVAGHPEAGTGAEEAGAVDVDMAAAGAAADEAGTADVDMEAAGAAAESEHATESALEEESESDSGSASKLSTDDELSDDEPNGAEFAEDMSDAEAAVGVEVAQPGLPAKADVLRRIKRRTTNEGREGWGGRE